MKKIIYTVLAVASIAACQPEANSDFEKLQHERDSLVMLQSEVKTQIKELDKQLTALDTTIKLSLVT